MVAIPEGPVLYYERRYIRASAISFFAAYLIGLFVTGVFFVYRIPLISPDWWMLWPVNLYYIDRIESKFGSIDGWIEFLVSNYALSMIMIIRFFYLLILEMVRPKNTFSWGITKVFLMAIPFALAGLLLPFSEGPSFYGLTFYHDPISNAFKSNFLVAGFYLGVTDPAVKFVGWVRFSFFPNR